MRFAPRGAVEPFRVAFDYLRELDELLWNARTLVLESRRGLVRDRALARRTGELVDLSRKVLARPLPLSVAEPESQPG